MIALAARILDLPEPELPLPPLRATARMSRPAAAAQAVVVMRDFILVAASTAAIPTAPTATAVARPATRPPRRGAGQPNYCELAAVTRGGDVLYMYVLQSKVML